MNQLQTRIDPQHLEIFNRRHQIRRLALFGSVLRPGFHPESDVVGLVLFDEEAQVGFMAPGQMQREISGIFRRKMDLVPQNGLKPAIREEVLKSAVESYAG